MPTVSQLVKKAEVQRQHGRIAESAELFKQALQKNPNHAEALHGFGLLLYHNGQADGAEAMFTRSLAAHPDAPKTRMLLGLTLWRLGRGEEAVAALRAALRQDQDSPEIHNNLAAILHRLDRFEEALPLYRRAMELDPTKPDPFQNLAVMQKELGLLEDSLETYRQAVERFPESAMARRGYLSLLTYLPDLETDDVFAAHKAYGNSLPPPSASPPFTNSRDGERRLKVGYVSSDFRMHPIARNMMPVLANHNRERFEIFGYGDVTAPDQITQNVAALCSHWRSVPKIADQALAEIIRKDGIDILVILGGHFDENHMALPRFKPAPVSIAFHDVATSGLAETDYLIADRTLAPRNTPEKFTERVLRLPSYYLHEPIAEAPEPGLPPCQKNGFVTFGAFNAPAKVNDKVLALWAGAMKAVPNSRLLLKYRTLHGSKTVRQRIVTVMKSLGIAEERLLFKASKDPLPQHLAAVAQADIALDTFPFSGSTSTFDALWMGVPVVTLPGDTMVSRWSASMLKTIGEEALIANNPESFIRIAGDLAKNLGELRQTLRPRLAASPLCNAPLRTRQIERLYEAVWKKWIEE